MLAAAMEALITRFSVDGRRTFFDLGQFPWIAELEAQTPAIRRELDQVLKRRELVPNFQDVSPDQAVLTEGEDWKTLILHGYGRPVPENCALCPQTERALQGIPGMKSAMFSILAPHKHIPGHRGPYKGVLRYHLGLIVPQPLQASGIKVGDDVRHWAEGQSLVFDDSHWHEAWNGTAQTRVVLFVDFLRPLPWWLSLLNRAMVWRLSTTPFITDIIRSARHAARRFVSAPAESAQ
jgi:ornithine lipid ester-linked acyl 2-hydroxylase